MTIQLANHSDTTLIVSTVLSDCMAAVLTSNMTMMLLSLLGHWCHWCSHWSQCWWLMVTIILCGQLWCCAEYDWAVSDVWLCGGWAGHHWHRSCSPELCCSAPRLSRDHGCCTGQPTLSLHSHLWSLQQTISIQLSSSHHSTHSQYNQFSHYIGNRSSTTLHFTTIDAQTLNKLKQDYGDVALLSNLLLGLNEEWLLSIEGRLVVKLL